MADANSTLEPEILDYEETVYDDSGEPIGKMTTKCVHLSEYNWMRGRYERTRDALVKAVAAVQQWHNGGLRGKDASELWDIYWRNAPEMKQIREALTDEQRGAE